MGELIVRLLEGLRAAVIAVGDRGRRRRRRISRRLLQGYVEGEYVRVAAPSAGTLERLAVARGEQVAGGRSCCSRSMPTAERRRARPGRWPICAAAEARLADLRKGKRAPEIEVIAAQKAQAEAMLALSEVSLRRQEQLAGTAAASQRAARCGARELPARPGAGRGARRRSSRSRAWPARERRDRGGRGGGRGSRGGARPGRVAAATSARRRRRRRRWSPTRSTGRASMSAPARRWSSCCRRPTSSCASSCPSRCSARLAVGAARALRLRRLPGRPERPDQLHRRPRPSTRRR